MPATDQEIRDTIRQMLEDWNRLKFSPVRSEARRQNSTGQVSESYLHTKGESNGH